MGFVPVFVTFLDRRISLPRERCEVVRQGKIAVFYFGIRV